MVDRPGAADMPAMNPAGTDGAPLAAPDGRRVGTGSPTARVPAPLPVGKVSAALLAACFARQTLHDPRVVVGPRVGEDAAVVAMGDRYLVATTDPITFVTEDLGWYALVVNANDLAVRGADPRWFLATCLLPEGRSTAAMVETLFAQLGQACQALDVSLIGGHTEVTHGLDRPVVVGTMLGEVAPDRLVTTAGARPGDALVLSKGIPVEGTSIMARVREQALRRRGHPETFLARARAYLGQLSVLPEARRARARPGVHAMHDPTEGGLATALWELAEAASVGVSVEAARVPVLPEGEVLCRELGLDPLGTIASGALLVAVDPSGVAPLLEDWAREGIAGAAIGEVLPQAAGVTLVRDGQSSPLPRFPQDEIARLFA